MDEIYKNLSNLSFEHITLVCKSIEYKEMILWMAFSDSGCQGLGMTSD